MHTELSGRSVFKPTVQKLQKKKDETLVELLKTVACLTYFALFNSTKWILHRAKQTTNRLGYVPLITALSTAVSPRPSLHTTIPVPKTVPQSLWKHFLKARSQIQHTITLYSTSRSMWQQPKELCQIPLNLQQQCWPLDPKLLLELILEIQKTHG